MCAWFVCGVWCECKVYKLWCGVCGVCVVCVVCVCGVCVVCVCVWGMCVV